MEGFDYDVLVVGSGFGGSVTALRATEKGYRVGVIEAGRRFSDEDFPKTSWRLRRFLWAPKLGMTGLQRIHFLRDVIVLAGSGVGGGSLVYANTLYVPPEKFFRDPQWADITDWASELGPYYDQAARMLGVTKNPRMTPADEVMLDVAEQMGVGDTFQLTPVGVYFGTTPGKTDPDPFFGGVGPARSACNECGSCMTGCRHGAKNTLPKNYLGLAESAGAQVLPLTTVTAVEPREGGGYDVMVERSGGWLRKGRRVLTAEQVVIAAGTFNTQKLLHRMRDEGKLPHLSPTLGRLSRTNSEALLGAIRRKGSQDATDYTRGVAITSSFYPEPDTHVEPVRYGKGSNVMGLLGTVMTDKESGVARSRTWLRTVARHPLQALSFLNVKGWSERSVIALVMQTLDNSVTVFSKRSRLGRWRMTSKQGEGEPNPDWIPAGNEAVRLMAERIDGTPAGNLGEVVGAPMTAHFVGGCVIGESPERGVVDAYHRAFGHEGLHVVDGSAITANLGVNPSLTITAQAERALAMWPNRGEQDLRPPLGDAYRQIAPIAPKSPFVPAGAPAALRLPIVEVRQGRLADTTEVAAGEAVVRAHQSEAS